MARNETNVWKMEHVFHLINLSFHQSLISVECLVIRKQQIIRKKFIRKLCPKKKCVSRLHAPSEEFLQLFSHEMSIKTSPPQVSHFDAQERMKITSDYQH